MRDIVFAFYESRYSKCLMLLQAIQENLKLDLFLSPHVDRLYAQIRNRALVQVSVAITLDFSTWS